MILPTDITTLVFNHVVAPSYKFANWVGDNIPDFANPEKLTKKSVIMALRNPMFTTRENWKILLRAMKINDNRMHIDSIVLSLFENHSKKAIRYIIQQPDRMDIIMRIYKTMGTGPIISLLRNPYSAPLVEELFKGNRILFNNLEIRESLASNICGENIILQPRSETKISFEFLPVQKNPSEKVMSNFYKPRSHVNQIGQLENHNIGLVPKVREVCYKYIEKYVKCPPINYNEIKMGELTDIIIGLGTNPSPYASSLLDLVLNNIIKNNNWDILVRHMLTTKNIIKNPSDYMVRFVSSHENKLGINSVCYLASNTNPEAIRLLEKILGYGYLEALKCKLAKNPGACEFIKSHLDMFIGVPELYSNPGIFISKTDRRLVSKLSKN